MQFQPHVLDPKHLCLLQKNRDVKCAILEYKESLHNCDKIP